ncbi:MAG: Activator of Hsp90 ATPase [Chloroflexi bacterium]|nr:Activator of Hsp90 ATPase [Chloroflexota bacterium]
MRTPVGDAWILAEDEATLRTEAGPDSGARMLPSGDAYFLLQGADRELLVPEADRRLALWTSRVWPGAVLLNGQLVGTWRRADRDIAIQPWQPLSPAERETVRVEAESLPLPAAPQQIRVRWID